MKKEYLPIGSVVLLKNTKKRLMITGFYVKPNNSNTFFDYLGCIFPEGMISDHDNYIFNNEQIEKVCYKGLVDEEETTFKARLYDIIGEKEGTQDNGIISIPVSLYEEYGLQKDDIISIPLEEYNRANGIISVPLDAYNKANGIISIPLDKYNEANGVICIPADLYEKAYGTAAQTDGVISIPADLYEQYNDNRTGADVISIPADLYEKELNKDIISIPLEVYKRANGVITVPLKQYEKMLNQRSVISINARTYEQFLEDEKHIISVPANAYLEATNQRMISIPLSVYERLQKREEVISIPLNVYEKMVNEGNNKVISIPLAEYERLTGGTEKDGVITIPSRVYDDLLRREQSNIANKQEVIEIPYDLYMKTQVENN